MKRKNFIKTCGLACLGTTTLGLSLQGCTSSKNLSIPLADNNLVLGKTDFIKNGGFYDYIVVSNPQLRFPIAVFRFSEEKYSALYLQCSHQGNELNVYGDKLVCSAHGSEFDNKGKVTKGPAADPLRSLPVQIGNNNILISLPSA
ncbi:MAG TPA: Rieske (2Fe-2S) protein [Arenibacter sp.]|nr:Rieske (2Fe-2S) protein [Arenibacter sp.]